MKSISILMQATLVIMSWAADAQTTSSATTTVTTEANTSTAKTSDLQNPQETRKDQSEEITNARMRADVGSKSKFSVKANLAYNGGSVEKPIERVRPNYRSGTTREVTTNLGGTLAVAYRATDKLTLRTGTGVTMETPFHNKDKDVGQNHNGEGSRIFNLSTPYLEASTRFRNGNLMVLPSFTFSYFSRQVQREVFKKDFDLMASVSGVYDIVGTGWQPGLTATIGNTFYQDGKRDSDVIGNANAREDYYGGIYPFLEYAFNDRYSFRTLIGISFTHVRSAPGDTFIKDKVYQSMGVGIAMTKEIYFYPNIQFLPDNVRGDLTNVGISSSMSVF